MPWYTNIIPEYIKKSVCTCLIKRYLNNFIENEITRDQLNLDLFNGRGTAERISLAVESLNELGETQNWPIEFVEGYIGKIDINVPWTTILKDPSYVEIHGLRLTVQPKQRKEDATSMFESMWNSMTSSMHLAEQFAKEEVANDKNVQAFEGVELFAQTIESIVGRIRIKFIDTCIQIEHLAKDAEKGVGLMLNIDVMEYFDECGNDPNTEEATQMTKEDVKKAYLIPSFTTKKLSVEGVKLSSIEFPVFTKAASESVSRCETGDSKENDNNPDDESISNSEGIRRDSFHESDDDVHVIMFGKICNRQEVRIKLKQSENIAGPKVAIEVNMGALILFISPRQFHLLMTLVDGFSSPSNDKRMNQKDKVKSKPMTDKDYEKIEKELQNLLNPYPSQALNFQGTHGWSTGAMDDSTEDYLPMKEATSGMYDSTLSGISSSMDSSINSSMISSMTDQSQRTNRRVSITDSDPTAEISRFHIRLASLAMVLLHEDMMSLPTENEQVLVRQMQNTVYKFFDNIDYSSFSSYGGKNFDQMNVSFEKACSLNHIRLLAAPIQIEADEKTTNSFFSMSGQMTASKVQLLECLYEGDRVKYVPLITFELSPENTSSPSFVKPSVKLKFKHVQKTGKSDVLKKSGPKTDLCIFLNKCLAEFDISIIDRITALLNYPSIFVSEQLDKGIQGQFVTPSNMDSILDLKISSPLLNLKLRFPVPDFRPPHDLSKHPWWERNVRRDYISLLLSDASFQTTFHTSQTYNEFSVDCKVLDVFYYESDNSPGLHIGKAGQNETYLSSMPHNSARTRLCIKIFPKRVELEDEMEPDPMAHSCYGAFENQGKSEPGPFAAKKVVHESDTPHSKLHRDDSEELIIPGDKSELEKFIKSTSSNAQIQVELFIPIVSVQLQSKHVYELIYNRISNDLLLWAPAAPKPSTDLYNTTGYGNFNALEFEDKFIMCKSGVQYESDSDSDDDSDEDSSNVFYSTYDKMKHSQKLTHSSSKGYRSQSYLTLNLHIGEGLVSLNPPVRDSSTNNVIPGQQGEFQLNVNNADIFIVNGYKGDSDLGYVCVQVKDAQLHHCDMQDIPSTSPPLREVGSVINRHLFPTIYRSDDNTLANSTSRGGNREMFTVAIKIKANHETHHVKVIQISLALNKATLRHRMCREPNTWISHLLDFFNVQDYPIAGYHAKDVLTELHLHLWDCAIDYRPLHLPLRSLINIGSFSLSSHLTAAANTSTLRFIFEDCNLFISDKAPPKNGVPSTVKVDLIKDYVNVVKLGLFEISLKTTNKKVGLNPHIDFRASNDLLHIRTCADSGRALMQLINYYASDGDLVPELAKCDSVSSSPKHTAEDELISVEQQDCTLTKSQQEQISELLEDAMEDSTEIGETEPECNIPATGTKVFYFPDEKERIQEKFPSKFSPQVTLELGDLNEYHFNVNSDTDDEFCIIGSEVGAEMFPKDGKSEIQWLTEEPVRIIENHFSLPVGKRDLLQPPKHFPTPLVRYTLCEMTVVWQMYGGNDFHVPERENKKKEVRFSEKQLSDKVTFSNLNSWVTMDTETNKKLIGMHWMQRGGRNRDHNVLMELQLNKVRFQHEVYPENTTQASRQVLLISDVEIRDRLKSSQINKFLYQYSSRARPKKCHSNMVVIKAVHVRPDPKLKSQECCLKISLLPIRLNIDQDALLFLIHFFKDLSGESPSTEPAIEASSKHSTPTHQPPIISISEENEDEIKQHAQKVVNENLILLMEESRLHDLEEQSSNLEKNETDDTPIYFRKVVFSHDVFIRIDYHGKRVDMTHGPLAGLLMGLGQLNCSELRLKRIVHRHGLLGFAKLVHFLLQEWLGDIKRSQLSTILGGVGPMHALLQLFQGVRDLFWLPIEQYQKDGRIVRGLQKGANSFTTSTAMAALELTTRIIYLIQITAETAYDMLSPGPSIRTKRLAKQKGRKKRYHQPQDIREGLTNACMVVKEGIGETADNILQLAVIEKEQKGYSGAVGAVIRQIPPTILKPIVIASEATTNVLGGMQSQLVPDARKEANQKWRTDDL